MWVWKIIEWICFNLLVGSLFLGILIVFIWLYDKIVVVIDFSIWEYVLRDDFVVVNYK